VKQKNPQEHSYSDHDFNIRRDLLAFVRYVQERDLKRSYRENEIPKADCKRLKKILKAPEVLREAEEEHCIWAEWISELARRMGLVSYDTEGEYMGYSSQAPSYPDNYIEVHENALDRYLALASTARERRVLAALVEHNNNEFYEPSLLGTRERFSTWGSAGGAASRMPLITVRTSLLKMLASYKPGETIAFSDFVNRVRSEMPNLIIDYTRKRDKEAAKAEKYYGGPRPLGPVYQCLYEFRLKEERGQIEKDYESREEIPENARDAFMRAEGRYLAYFLEEIPVLMQFVHLNYTKPAEPRVSPPLPDFIQSFTVTEKLAGVLDNESPHFDAVNVTVTPDFKIFVEAPLFPDAVLARLAPYTTLKSEDKYTTTLELSRKKTIETLTTSPSARPLMEVLVEVAGKVPRNVLADIGEWTGHADKFVVFEDVGLLEFTDAGPDDCPEIIREIENAITRKISGRFHILHHPDDVYDHLERLEQIPKRVKHHAHRLHNSLLKAPTAKKPRSRAKAGQRDSLKKITIVQSGLVGFTCDNLEFLRSLARHLEESGITPVFFDKARAIVAVPDEARPKATAFLRKMRSRFNLEIQ